MKKYLEQINPVIERLIIDLLIDMPEDLSTFSEKWLDSKGRRINMGIKVPKSP